MAGIHKRFGRLPWRRMGGRHKLFDLGRRTAGFLELGQFAYSQSRPGFREARRLERRKIRYRFFALRRGAYKSTGWQRAGIQLVARPTAITSLGTLSIVVAAGGVRRKAHSSRRTSGANGGFK